MKKLIFGLLISIISTIGAAILIHCLWGPHISDINNIPLFSLIIFIQLLGAVTGGDVIGEYINTKLSS